MSRDFSGAATAIIGLPITAVLRPSLPVTVAAWVNLDTIGAGDGFFTSNRDGATHRGFSFSISDSSGHLSASYGDNGGSASNNRRSKVSASAVTTGAWQHIACCIRGAGDMDIYIAGSDAGGSYSGTGGAMAYNTGIGGRIGTVGGNAMDGRLAEVGLWTVTLSAAEVLAMAKGVSPLGIRPGSLLGHWPLWGAADPEIDLSMNLNNTTGIIDAVSANHAPVGSPFPVSS